MGRVFFKTIVTLSVSYIAVCLFMYQQQRTLLYYPILGKIAPQQVGASDAQIINVTTQDGINLEGWHFPPSQPHKKTIIFFHGNGWLIGNSFANMKRYLDAGYGLLMVEYRGYAGHAGKVTEQGLYKDSRAYIDWLHSEHKVHYKDMIFYGESLGSALAVRMASEYQPHAVILLSSFSSMLELAQERYPYIPASFLLIDTYLNEAIIKDISSPVLFLHGQLDGLVHYKYGEKLYAAANEPKQFTKFANGTHVNLYNLGAEEVILTFLDHLDKHEQKERP